MDAYPQRSLARAPDRLDRGALPATDHDAFGRRACRLALRARRCSRYAGRFSREPERARGHELWRAQLVVSRSFSARRLDSWNGVEPSGLPRGASRRRERNRCRSLSVGLCTFSGAKVRGSAFRVDSPSRARRDRLARRVQDERIRSVRKRFLPRSNRGARGMVCAIPDPGTTPPSWPMVLTAVELCLCVERSANVRRRYFWGRVPWRAFSLSATPPARGCDGALFYVRDAALSRPDHGGLSS